MDAMTALECRTSGAGESRTECSACRLEKAARADPFQLGGALATAIISQAIVETTASVYRIAACRAATVRLGDNWLGRTNLGCSDAVSVFAVACRDELQGDQVDSCSV